ncbi:MAG: hypothetical protein ACRDOO_21825 [Actinomadura sp.]
MRTFHTIYLDDGADDELETYLLAQGAEPAADSPIYLITEDTKVDPWPERY